MGGNGDENLPHALMMTGPLEGVYLRVVKHMVDGILRPLVFEADSRKVDSVYQKSAAAILNRGNELHLRSVEFRLAEKVGACENTMQGTSKFICNDQWKPFELWDMFVREMLLMKSDFILFDVSASRRLISTIKEFVKAERYASSDSTVKTGTANSVQTKHPA